MTAPANTVAHVVRASSGSWRGEWGNLGQGVSRGCSCAGSRRGVFGETRLCVSQGWNCKGGATGHAGVNAFTFCRRCPAGRLLGPRGREGEG